MPGRVLMVQGTMSSVGKSLTVAALCRIFAQDGMRVAPFKAQNMALNSYVTLDGREVGRAQAMQAAAAGVDVTVEMNPVLMKPEADSVAQIVVLGKPWRRLSAREYFSNRSQLWETVTGALDTLRQSHDLVVIEGAGSPAELNLKRGDLVNMAIAKYANAPVLLVGDIDRGGVFAQLLGTLDLLEADERALIQGLIVNKFRGDISLFHDGVAILEQRGKVPVLGVVPYVPDLQIADEDSVVLDELRAGNRDAALTIAVIGLPHMSNFDDFDPLRAEHDVQVHFVRHPSELSQPDLVILPGTKSTIADLAWLRERGLADQIIALANKGTAILGICGGYQMLGLTINDPLHVESASDSVVGLGLLLASTTFFPNKRTERVQATMLASSGLFQTAHGQQFGGYEIHMGATSLLAGAQPLVQLADGALDGGIAADGLVAGCYLHGFFDDDQLRSTLLHTLALRKGVIRGIGVRFNREGEYDRLADAMRSSLDMQRLYALLDQQG